jgi:hypothetical protein
LAISEEESDDSSTYLRGGSATSTFAFSCILHESKIKTIQSGRIYLDFTVPVQHGHIRVGEIQVKLHVDKTEVGTYEYQITDDVSLLSSHTFNITEDNLNIISDYLTSKGYLPNIWVSVMFSIDYASNDSGKGGGSGNLTQMYISLTYEESTGLFIYHKVGSSWKQAQSAYRKQNGAWAEITEEECKTILQSSFIIQNK